MFNLIEDMNLTEHISATTKQIEDYSACCIAIKDQKLCKALTTQDNVEYESYLNNNIEHEC